MPAEKSWGSALHQWITSPSMRLSTSEVWQGKVSQVTDSSVLVINKSIPAPFYALLLHCNLNHGRALRILNKKSVPMGDRFWLASEWMQVPHYITRQYTGVIGYLINGTRICGMDLYLAPEQTPYWWLGGMRIRNEDWMDFEAWTSNSASTDKVYWSFEGKLPCYNFPDTHQEVSLLDAYSQSMIPLLRNESVSVDAMADDAYF